ncbi:c-type cytochrome [Salinisphaera sp. PC39]|uniref:c-type cytochrome n=1 Tax=Salinisphaera sp. PC39 TaxID=1304156 RepID=UPI003340BF17
MSADHDRTFVRTFLAVLGALVAFTFVIIFIARTIMSAAGPDEMLPEERARIEQRAEPVFEVVTDPAQAQKVAQASAPSGGEETAAEPKSGEEVYNSVCSACHQAGVAGAPKTTDTAAWQQRLDGGGKNTLYDHAINGFNAMPAKGGNPGLSDEEVEKAVDHMLEQAGV